LKIRKRRGRKVVKNFTMLFQTDQRPSVAINAKEIFSVKETFETSQTKKKEFFLREWLQRKKTTVF
jgi:hypothetical protein